MNGIQVVLMRNVRIQEVLVFRLLKRMSDIRSEQTNVRTTHRTHDHDHDVSGRDHCEFPSLSGAPFSER